MLKGVLYGIGKDFGGNTYKIIYGQHSRLTEIGTLKCYEQLRNHFFQWTLCHIGILNTYTG